MLSRHNPSPLPPGRAERAGERLAEGDLEHPPAASRRGTRTGSLILVQDAGDTLSKVRHDPYAGPARGCLAPVAGPAPGRRKGWMFSAEAILAHLLPAVPLHHSPTTVGLSTNHERVAS